MASLQAKAMAGAGYFVLQIDLYGCGDSAGDFGDALWERWIVSTTPSLLKSATASSMPESGKAGLMRLSGIVEESIVDGPGLRYVLFTQGCPHHCKGCHNPQTHSFEGGFLLSAEAALVQLQENPLLSGITLSGGEPFEQAEALCALAEGAKALGKSVMAYTGYVFEDLLARNDPWTNRLLELTDVLVDGPYKEELRDLELQFRGSANQRLLDRAERERLAAAFYGQ